MLIEYFTYNKLKCNEELQLKGFFIINNNKLTCKLGNYLYYLLNDDVFYFDSVLK